MLSDCNNVVVVVVGVRLKTTHREKERDILHPFPFPNGNESLQEDWRAAATRAMVL